jgi:hypothetical protein
MTAYKVSMLSNRVIMEAYNLSMVNYKMSVMPYNMSMILKKGEHDGLYGQLLPDQVSMMRY